jgi:D-serine dehydratase
VENLFANSVIESTYKSFPITSYGKNLTHFLAAKPNIFSADFQFPLMVLKQSALDNNILTMATYCKSIGAQLAPHVKTTMSPEIAQMQVRAGAYGLTVANFWQAQIFLNFGFRKLIIANEVVDPTAIIKISEINKSKEGEILFYVDSLAGLELVQKHTPETGLQNLLIEIGVKDGRGGVRELALVAQIANLIKSDSRFRLSGVTGFEGSVPTAARSRKGERDIKKFCQKIVEAAELIYPGSSTEPFIISAGGSAYFEIVAQELNKFSKPKLLLLRSGGYVTHDSKYYEQIYPATALSKKFQPAIEVWTQVLSTPQPGFGVLNIGKRDVGNDLGNPMPFAKFNGSLDSFSGEVVKLNDQHGYLKSKADFKVGDLVGLGISHPCTTFDKWRLIPVVNDSYDVVDCFHTFF